MNYPTTVTNPLLKKHQDMAEANLKAEQQKQEQKAQEFKFSNHDRPVSCPHVPLQRPFSTHFQSGLKQQPTRILSKAGAEKMSSATIANQIANKQALLAAESQANLQDGASAAGDDKGNLGGGSKMDLVKPSMMSVGEDREDLDESLEQLDKAGPLSAFQATTKGMSVASTCFGKSIHNSNFKDVGRSTINTVENHVAAMPMPKKFAMAKKKAEREEKKAKLAEEKAAKEAAEAAGIKLPKAPKKNKFAYPTPDPLPPPKPLTVAEAMASATSWNAANVIANKYSAGTATTAAYEDRTSVFSRMNPLAEEKGSLYP